MEEEKEELELSPRRSAELNDTTIPKEQIGDEHSFTSQLDSLVKTMFGSCTNALEAASFFVQERGGGACRWPLHGAAQSSKEKNAANNPVRPAAPPLSIADELRRLAIAEGRDPDARYQPPRPADIPKFLGEDAVYSFEGG